MTQTPKLTVRKTKFFPSPISKKCSMRRREPSKLFRKLLSKSPASIVQRGGVIPAPLSTVRTAQDRREKHFSQKWEPMTLVERNFFFKKQAALNSPGRPGLLRGGGVLPPPPLDRNFSRFGKFRQNNVAMENPQFYRYLPGKMGIFMGYVSFKEGTPPENERIRPPKKVPNFKKN